ncbi:MAG: 3-oxoacyl-[acyl-carrier-protein] reductase [Candidatus Riflebacteria bacterium]|nr:3-oxoacyl-[acyl-carrier-protein] reductase [Candidatus Riflebacteria bacterium]
MSNSSENSKVVIVTGSARGIGFATAKAFASEGYKVMLSGRNSAALEKAAEDLKASGSQVSFCSADVSIASDADRLVQQTISEFGRIDVLVNNAGVTKDNLLLRMSEQDWETVIDINLKGAFLMSKAVAKQMLKQKSGAVINIASVVGLTGNAGQANYSASKAGLIALTKTFAKEFGKKGLRANAVAPGFINSDMTETLPDDLKEQIKQQTALKKFGDVSNVADAVVFLASDKAEYITGQVLTVDGGMVMA